MAAEIHVIRANHMYQFLVQIRMVSHGVEQRWSSHHFLSLELVSVTSVYAMVRRSITGIFKSYSPSRSPRGFLPID